jgi:lipopolysaccharide transport system permease protein
MIQTKSLKDIYFLRKKLMIGVVSDIRQRYVGSLFGWLWAILFPLMQLAIYATLYAIVFRIKVPGLSEMDYVILIFSGLVPIMAFNMALTGSSSSIYANKTMLLNSAFPPDLVPLRAGIAAQVPPLFGLIITLLVGVFLGGTSWQAIVMVPILWTLIVMFAIGLGWILSLLSLVLKDVQEVLGIIIMLLTVLSPFAYTPEMIPDSLKFVIYLNPISYFVLCFQQVVCFGSWPDLHIFLIAFCISISSFMGGLYVFQKGKGIFFDYA